MPFDWADFSGDSGLADKPLLLSERSQSIILTALDWLQRRYAWADVDDAVWDDIEGATTQALHEIIEVSMPDFTPVGTILAYAGILSSIPAKWRLCNGDLLPVGDYPELRAVLDDPFDDNVNLTLPDLRDRFIYGASFNNDLGQVDGSETVTLTIAEIPSHTHILHTSNVTGNNAFRAAQGGATGLQSVVPSDDIGNGAAHGNMPPFMMLYYIIKVLP